MRYPFEQPRVSEPAVQESDNGLQDTGVSRDTVHQLPETATLQLSSRSRRNDGGRGLSKSRRREAVYPVIIEKDISMTMRARVIAGYNLQNVS